MGECAQTRELCRVLEAQGALTYPMVAGTMVPPGWPDRYVAHLRWQGMLEFKSHKGVLTSLQARILCELNQRRVNVAVIRFNADWSKVCIDDRWNTTDGVAVATYVKYNELLEELVCHR